MSKFISIENETVESTDGFEESEFRPETMDEYRDFIFDTDKEISEECHQADRVIDTIYALEALCADLESTGVLTDADAERLKAAGMFASTGTDAGVGDIVPALEAQTDKTIAVEAVLSKIENGIASLSASNKLISSRIAQRKASLGVAMEFFGNQQEDLLAYIQKAGKEKTVTIKLDYLDNTSFKTFNDFLKNTEQNVNELENFINTYVREIPVINKGVLHVFGSITKGNYNVAMADAFNTFNDQQLMKVTKNWKIAKTSEGKTLVSSNFYGSNAIAITTSKDRMTPDTDRGTVREMIANLDWKLETGKFARSKTTVTFEKVNVSQLKSLYEMNKRLLKALDIYEGSRLKLAPIDREVVSNTIKAIMIMLNAITVGPVAGGIGAVVGSFAGLPIAGFLAGVTASAGAAYLTGAMINAIRKFVLQFIFSAYKLQYRITSYMYFVDSHVISIAKRTIDLNSRVIKS